MKTTKLLTTIVLFCISLTAIPANMTKNEKAFLEVRKIERMVKHLEPSMSDKDANKIAYLINKNAKKFKIDPKIMLSIIDTESDFRQDAVSSSGDISIVQINADVWVSEFKRRGMGELNVAKLKKSEGYAILKMAQILNELKTKHAKTDPKWFARYHSKTLKFKNPYAKKVETRMRAIASL